MESSQVRVHDCFDVLAGESKPLKCNCPNRVSPQEAQELVDSGKAKFLNRWSIASLVVRNPVARVANREVFAANETDHEFIQKFRTSMPGSKLSESDLLDGIKNPEQFNGSDAYPAGRQLSKHYWNKALVNRGLSKFRGEFMTDAPHGRGQLISGGYNSKKVENVNAQQDKEGSLRVETANFRKGEFNGGFISSPSSAPDKFEDLPWFSIRKCLADPMNSHEMMCDPNQDEWHSYFTWVMGQIAAKVLSMRNKGYSEEIMMDEIMWIVNPVFSKNTVRLICRGCGIQTEQELNMPPDVAVPVKKYFTCRKCNGLLMDKGRRMPRRKIHVPKEEAKAA